MRKIINSTYVTLDGVIQDPQDWPSMGGFSSDGGRVQTALLESCDAVLLGQILAQLLRIGPAAQFEPAGDVDEGVVALANDVFEFIAQ